MIKLPLAEFFASPTAAMDLAEHGEPVVVVNPDGSTHSVIHIPNDDRPFIDDNNRVPSSGAWAWNEMLVAANKRAEAAEQRAARLEALLRDTSAKLAQLKDPFALAIKAGIDAELAKGGAW